MVLGKTIQSLSVVAAGAFAMAAPFTPLDTMFKAGPDYHILTVGTAFRKEADTTSKTKGILMPGSCVRWIESALDAARIHINTGTDTKNVWVDAALLRPAPPEKGKGNCKARIAPPASTLDARLK